jgi:hypothetical protein
MSRHQDQDGSEKSSATLKKIEQAILRVGAIRQQYIDSCQRGPIPQQLQKEFHSAVINYYIELRPFRDHKNVKEEWQSATILTNDGDEVEGLENLLDWVDKTRASKASSPGRSTTTHGSREPDTLPPRQLLRISMKLDDVAHELGFSPDSKTPVADASEAVV